MADDIVARLRAMRGPNVWEAADEIERLRSALRIYACDCPRNFCKAVATDEELVCGFDARAALAGAKAND